jgi:hypothetical protein
MMKAYITYSDKTTTIKVYKSLATALRELRINLEVGDSFVIREGKKLLAKCTITDYKGDYI